MKDVYNNEIMSAHSYELSSADFDVMITDNRDQEGIVLICEYDAQTYFLLSYDLDSDKALDDNAESCAHDHFLSVYHREDELMTCLLHCDNRENALRGLKLQLSADLVLPCADYA